MEEIWKPIPGYEELYQASNLGRIKGQRGWVLKPGTDPVTGYLHVILVKEKSHKGKYVHRLVWEAFNGPIEKGLEINHIDEDKSNNSLDNLELMTHKQNMNYGNRAEKHRQTMLERGNFGKCRKAVNQYSFPEREFIKRYESLTQAAGETGACIQNISACIHGRVANAGGFIWEFA